MTQTNAETSVHESPVAIDRAVAAGAPGRQLSAGQQRNSLTLRSLLIGTLAAGLVCGLTPYNDFVLSDTSLVTGFVPAAAVLIEFLLIVGINAPLHRFAPRYALRTGELAVILLMTLVACGIPNWGLMRFFIPMPVAPFHVGTFDEPFWRAFLKMDLPRWLFPVENIAEGRSDPVVTWFYQRVPAGQSIPWSAWVVPLLAWGVFGMAMLATLTAIARLVFDQWAVNERLPFPLVQVQAALIEPPPPGKGLNALFRNPWLWIGLGSVFAIHSLNTLAIYFPRHFETIPLGYNFGGFIPETPTPGQPLSFLDNKIKRASISFIIVGVTYFIRSKAAFSLWGMYFLINLFQVQYGMRGGTELGSAALQDQHLGAVVAFVAGIFWIGREQWKRVISNSLRPSGGDRTYRGPFWVAVGGVAVMLGWLLAVGVHVFIAVLIVVMILTAHLVVARVVAETGLPLYRAGIAPAQIYSNFPVSLWSGRDMYFASVGQVLGPLTPRDSIMSFTATGLGIAHSAHVEEDETGAGNAPRRPHRRLGLIIAWTLVVGFVVAAASTLYCQYSYPTPLTEDIKPQGNYFGASYIPRRDIAPPVVYHSNNSYVPRRHSRLLHVTIGLLLTAGLQFASLRWTSWPLLPVGYVASYGAFVGNAWFSIFLGWLAKVMIVRFGGSSLFLRARPLFVGIIFGEALAAGIWLIINAIAVMNGADMKSFKILP